MKTWTKTRMAPALLWGALLALAVGPSLTADEPGQGSAQTEGKTADGEQREENGEDGQLLIYDEVEVRERGDDLVGIASSAAEGSTGAEDLQRRPVLRPGELVETTPGVVATQHSGGGKANQYFLRGFNLDHGTDFSVKVAGVPVNQPTHGHGQGYADLSFLIPELVERVRYRKGPYHASLGDFSAAGGVEMELMDTLPGGLASLTGGTDDYGRALLARSFKVGGGDLLAAVDLFHEDGPWTRGNDFEGFRGLLRFSQGDSRRGSSLTFMGYDADWLSTDQVPRRAVEGGLIGRFDLIDPGPRGFTERYSLSGEIRRGTNETLTRLGGYLKTSDFGLVSNFTYFLEDEEAGDQFEQEDQRFVAGVDLAHSRLGSWGGRSVRRSFEVTVGLQIRYDDIENGLFRTQDLERLSTVRTDDVQQITGGPYVETQVRWNPWFRSRFGLRADAYRTEVESDLAANSGSEDDFLLSPKLSLIFGPWSSTELYVNAGYGFHSNDARGATLTVDPATGQPALPVDPLVRAKGADVGVRTTAVPGLQTTLTVFGLELDSELVFVGDGGATEASRPSRRVGVELTNAYQVNRWLFLDLDVTLTDAEFTDEAPEGNEIPGAVGRTVAAGISVDGWGNAFGSLRWRYFSDTPLIEDGSAEWDSSSLVNAKIGYRFENGLSLALEIFNLLDREDADIQYFYASRLPGEPSGGFDDVHFHPLESRSARLVATWWP